MSPNSVYLLHENLPEYGLIAHLYVESNHIVKSAFSIIKVIEKKGEMLSVWPIDMLWQKADIVGKKEMERELAILLNHIYGSYEMDNLVQKEYEIEG